MVMISSTGVWTPYFFSVTEIFLPHYSSKESSVSPIITNIIASPRSLEEEDFEFEASSAISGEFKSLTGADAGWEIERDENGSTNGLVMVQEDESHIDVEQWGINMAQVVGQKVPLQPSCSALFLGSASSSRIQGGSGCCSSYHIQDGAFRPFGRLDETPFALHPDEMILDIDIPITPEAEEDPYDFFFEEDNDYLRMLRRDPRNLVLDSTCPEIAPHIVITPPDADWTDLVVMRENAAPQQSSDYLTVSLPNSSLTSHSPVEPVAGNEQIFECPEPEDVPIEQHLRCFSPSRFSQMIAETSDERFNMHYLIPPLNKRLYHVCAWLASVEACTFREHYDTSFSSAFSHLETEFRWTDPALPILAEARKYHGTLIIDSPTPSITPHIIINEPPLFDSNPWVNAFNSTQNPQDCAFGRCLTVPSRLVEVINLPDRKSDSSYHYDEDERTASVSSIPPTPFLLTPIEEEDEEVSGASYSSYLTSSFFREEEEDAEDRDECQDGDDDDEDDCETDHEDEDDLPPLDDWYIQIASRTGVLISS